jgi:hypothetical protein
MAAAAVSLKTTKDNNILKTKNSKGEQKFCTLLKLSDVSRISHSCCQPVLRIHDILDPDYGSRSTDPCLRLMDPDLNPDPAIFVIDLEDANKKLI